MQCSTLAVYVAQPDTLTRSLNQDTFCIYIYTVCTLNCFNIFLLGSYRLASLLHFILCVILIN